MIIHHSSVVELTNITIDSNKVPISGYFVHHWNLPASWSLWSPNLYNDPSNYTLYHHLSKLAWIRTWLNRFCGDGLQLTQLKHIDQLLINNRSINSQVVGGGLTYPLLKCFDQLHRIFSKKVNVTTWHHFPPLPYRVIQKNTTSNVETEQISEVRNALEFPCFTFNLNQYWKKETNHTWKITLLKPSSNFAPWTNKQKICTQRRK